MFNIKEEEDDINSSDSAHKIKCEICDKVMRKKTIRNHINAVHLKLKPYQCDKCPAKFANKGSLNVHKVIHSDERDFKCKTCNKLFKTKAFLKRHSLIHLDARPYVCEECGNSFKDPSTLISHRKDQHSQFLPFNCHTCKKGFSKENKLKLHIKTHDEYYAPKPKMILNRDNKRKAFSEEEKDKLLERVGQIGMNRTAREQGVSSSVILSWSNVRREKFKCDECDRSFKNSYVLRIHIFGTHKKQKKFNAHSFDYKFREKVVQYAKEHSLQETSKEFNIVERSIQRWVKLFKNAFTCLVCQRVFSNQLNVREHLVKKHKIESQEEQEKNIKRVTTEEDSGDTMKPEKKSLQNKIKCKTRPIGPYPIQQDITNNLENHKMDKTSLDDPNKQEVDLNKEHEIDCRKAVKIDEKKYNENDHEKNDEIDEKREHDKDEKKDNEIDERKENEMYAKKETERYDRIVNDNYKDEIDNKEENERFFVLLANLFKWIFWCLEVSRVIDKRPVNIANVWEEEENIDSNLKENEGDGSVREEEDDNSCKDKESQSRVVNKVLRRNLEGISETNENIFVEHGMKIEPEDELPVKIKIETNDEVVKQKRKRGQTKRHPKKCNICEKEFGDITKLRFHLYTHTEEKPFECDVCQKRFNHPSHFKRHVVGHKEKTIPCHHCSKLFSDQTLLNIHLKAIDLSFKCNLCGNVYPRKQNLEAHVRRKHTGETPYSCSHCDSKFNMSHKLKAHIIKHHTDSPIQMFVCEFCGKEYRKKSSMVEHARTHSGNSANGSSMKPIY